MCYNEYNLKNMIFLNCMYTVQSVLFKCLSMILVISKWKIFQIIKCRAAETIQRMVRGWMVKQRLENIGEEVENIDEDVENIGEELTDEEDSEGEEEERVSWRLELSH